MVGADRNGGLLREMFRDLGIDTRSLVVDPDRPTIVKERMLGSVQSANRATQQLLRVDEEDPRPLSPAREARAEASASPRELTRADGVLISDINKGLLTPGLLRALIDGASPRQFPVIIDPRLSEDFSIYRGATALTPNRFETEVATGMRLNDRAAWRTAAETLVRKLGLEACLITLDRDGMYLAERGGADTYIPTTPREVYDVTGAGDVVLGVFGLMAIAGLSFSSAATIANLAAGIEVGRDRHRDHLARGSGAGAEAGARQYERKIVSADELTAGAGARAPRRPPDRLYQRMLRPAARRSSADALASRARRATCWWSDSTAIAACARSRAPAGRSIRRRSRPNAGGARSRRLRGGLRRNPRRAVIRAVRPDILVKGEDYRGQDR